MAWVRLDDGFADHPKILAAGPFALVAQVRALCYCARHLTDGHLPKSAVKTIFAGLSTLTARQMCLAQLWHKNGSGFIIHDYLKYNPSRVDTLQLREKKVLAGHLGGVAKAIADATSRATARAMAPSRPLPLPVETTTPISGLPVDKSIEHEAKKAAALALLKRAGLTPP